MKHDASCSAAMTTARIQIIHWLNNEDKVLWRMMLIQHVTRT